VFAPSVAAALHVFSTPADAEVAVTRIVYQHTVPPGEAEAFARAWQRCKLHTLGKAQGLVEAVLLRSASRPGEFLTLSTWEREEDWRAYWSKGVPDPEGDVRKNEQWVEVQAVRR
jgi:heme-degrading monooxygenase HmoA